MIEITQALILVKYIYSQFQHRVTFFFLWSLKCFCPIFLTPCLSCVSHMKHGTYCLGMHVSYMTQLSNFSITRVTSDLCKEVLCYSEHMKQGLTKNLETSMEIYGKLRKNVVDRHSINTHTHICTLTPVINW